MPVTLAPVLTGPSEAFTAQGQTTFSWTWPGPPLTANQGFEVRIWKEGQPDHYGAAAPTGGTSITIDPRGAFGVQQGGAGKYFWTVALVQREPYKRIGSEAAPRTLEVAQEGNVVPPCVGPGCEK